MTTKSAVDGFLSQKTLVVFGVSRSGKKFGNMAAKELRAKGYRVIPVHPEADAVDGEKCYQSLKDVPGAVGGALIVVKPSETDKVVREVADAGVKHLWLQQGAESEEAIEFCEQNELNVVHGECILMFAEPVGSFHRFHRWLWGVFGKLPK